MTDSAAVELDTAEGQSRLYEAEYLAVVRLARLVTGSAAGDAGGRARFIEFGTSSFYLLSHYYNARRTPIYGGSNEIQRNILAKQVLRMPSR